MEIVKLEYGGETFNGIRFGYVDEDDTQVEGSMVASKDLEFFILNEDGEHLDDDAMILDCNIYGYIDIDDKDIPDTLLNSPEKIKQEILATDSYLKEIY